MVNARVFVLKVLPNEGICRERAEAGNQVESEGKEYQRKVNFG